MASEQIDHGDDVGDGGGTATTITGRQRGILHVSADEVARDLSRREDYSHLLRQHYDYRPGDGGRRSPELEVPARRYTQQLATSGGPERPPSSSIYPIKDVVADGLTRSLGGDQHTEIVRQLGLVVSEAVVHRVK